KTSGVFVHVFRTLLSHEVGHGGHGDFLEETGNHLGSDQIAAVFEELDGGAVGGGSAERNRIFSEAARDDEGHRRIASSDRGFRGGGGVILGLNTGLWRRSFLYRQRCFALQALDQPLRGGAVVFIGD